MSEGTRDQLYLALRVAAVEAHATQAEPLPFIADDLLVNFDHRRADAALALLSQLGRTTQVVLFTHHEHIVDLARRQTGLLDGHEAIVHWAYAAMLARHHPRLRIDPERSLVVTGPDQRIVMAGGGTAHLDLCMYLIARHAGMAEATDVARTFLINWHEQGQKPFRVLAARQAEDALIARCQAWVADHYAEGAPVAAMIRLSGLAERTFARRFMAATGMLPLDYIHALRLEEAKQMLETEDLPVEAIAFEVGYQDSSFFGRLFRRRVGLTPMQYRRRFATLRHMLGRPAAPESGREP